jgi:hypothetical protein
MTDSTDEDAWLEVEIGVELFVKVTIVGQQLGGIFEGLGTIEVSGSGSQYGSHELSHSSSSSP